MPHATYATLSWLNSGVPDSVVKQFFRSQRNRGVFSTGWIRLLRNSSLHSSSLSNSSPFTCCHVTHVTMSPQWTILAWILVLSTPEYTATMEIVIAAQVPAIATASTVSLPKPAVELQLI